MDQNLNLLGEREKETIWKFYTQDINKECKEFAENNDIELFTFQSNLEGNLWKKFKIQEINMMD